MDFSKVTNFFSDWLGNPFATPVGQLIEKATDITQASEDWALYMEICDVINSKEDGPQDAARALKKLITNNVGKSNIAIMYALTVLETCVKNCGMRFHIFVAQKEFLQELVKLAMPRNNPPHFVLDKVLGLIQTWADAFRGEPELKEFVAVYEELKEKGCEFPMTDLDNIPPIHTPARSVSKVEPVSHSESAAVPQGELPMVGIGGGPVTLDVDQMAKLRSELDIVQQNCNVFGEMLTEQTPGQEQADDWALMQELNVTCHTMQKRIMELIEQLQNEDVTAELLHINDQLNNVALRYERFERMRGGGSSVPASQSDADSAATAPALHSTAYPPPAAVTESHDIETGTLVDLGDTSTRLSGPAAEVNGQGTVPASSSGKPINEDFDMFAQSRQSFQENLPRVNRDAYQDQEEDQRLSGLAAAVTLKSRGVTYKEEEVDEMEQWLKSTEMDDDGPKETATSSEFDAFLATREKEANSSTSGPTVNRGGRTLQNAEDEQALFSL